jgi:hypothetical protein
MSALGQDRPLQPSQPYDRFAPKAVIQPTSANVSFVSMGAAAVVISL